VIVRFTAGTEIFYYFPFVEAPDAGNDPEKTEGAITWKRSIILNSF
jgi:hypothetical protein